MPTPRSQYSIDQAPDSLAQLVDQAEQGAIELVRQGKPVAVILSAADYNRMAGQKGDFGTALAAFRESLQLEQLDIDPDEVFKDVRDRSPGRDIIL